MRWKAYAAVLAVFCSFWLVNGQPAAADLIPNIVFTAYNDTVSGPGTHANTTDYADNAVSSGPLKNIDTGRYTHAVLSTSAQGVTYQNATGGPSRGGDAYNIFSGYVDFTSNNGNSLELQGSDSYTYSFTNLVTTNIYEFAGTAIRGNSGYTNRWTLITIVGADSFMPAHSIGAGIVTAGLPNNQVALWTGDNSTADQGFVVQFKDIVPGDDGQFQVVSEQYTGSIPGGTADGSKGYAINGIRFVEIVPEPTTLALLSFGAITLLRRRSVH